MGFSLDTCNDGSVRRSGRCDAPGVTEVQVRFSVATMYKLMPLSSKKGPKYTSHEYAVKAGSNNHWKWVERSAQWYVKREALEIEYSA